MREMQDRNNSDSSAQVGREAQAEREAPLEEEEMNSKRVRKCY